MTTNQDIIINDKLKQKKEAQRQASLRYYQKNKENIINKSNAYNKEHPAQHNAQQRQTYLNIKASPDRSAKLKEYHRQRYKAYKENTSGTDSGNGSS